MCESYGSGLAGRKIILIAQYGRSGGTRTYLRQLIDFYTRHDVRLIVVRDGPQVDPEVDTWIMGPGHQSLHCTEVLNTKYFGLWDKLSGGVSERRFLAELEGFGALAERESADIVVGSVAHPGSLLGAVSSSLRGIYLLHTFPHGVRSRVLHPVKAMMLPATVQFVTVSQFAITAMSRSWPINRGEVVSLHSTAGPPLRGAVMDRQVPARVLTLGHVDHHKDPETWVNVAERILDSHPSVRFVWAGEGPLLNKYRRIVRTRKLSSNVEFRGLVSDVSPLMREATVYMQPSLVENPSLAVLDASRHGVPCVVSSVGGLPEIVENGKTGLLVSPRDEQGFSEAVRRVINEPAIARDLGQSARKRYEEYSSPDAWAQRMLRLHEGVLRRSWHA